jgi:TRAP-type C4-dicarboxylate transport system permease small subunit
VSAFKKVLDTLLAWLCIALFAALVLVVTWQVLSRQVLGDPSTWSSTAAQYLFVWLSLFGAAYVFSERGHIAVDFVARKAGPRAQRVVGVLTQLVILSFAGCVLLWGGLRGVGLTWSQNVSGLPVTVGQMYLALPVSGALIAFYALYHLYKIAVGREAGLPINEDEEIGRHTSAVPLIASEDPRLGPTGVDSTAAPGTGPALRPGAEPPADPGTEPGTDAEKGR